MNCIVNVPRVIQAMAANGWGVAATAVNCRVNNKTVAKILDGKVPRMDALKRLVDHLNIPMEEALIVRAPKKT